MTSLQAPASFHTSPTVAYARMEGFDIDVERGHIEISVRGRRHYDFDTVPVQDDALVAFQSAPRER